jgi:hypothetical protein
MDTKYPFKEEKNTHVDTKYPKREKNDAIP